MSYPFVQARWFRKGRIKPVEVIVLHSMEAKELGSTAENVAAYFSRTDTQASAHLCIDSDSIVQCVQFSDTAFAAKNANSNGIHLEHAGFAKQTRAEWLDEYGQRMLELSAKAAAALCKQFNIPPQRAVFAGKDNPRVIQKGICGHADVPLHGSHYDPGPFFPLDWYLERVKFYLNEQE